MINCFVRALRRRRPSIRAEGLEMAADKDFQVKVRAAADWARVSICKLRLIICKLQSGFGQFGNETPNAANCESGAANFSCYCNKVLEVTNQ
jgi:hypothetical protein